MEISYRELFIFIKAAVWLLTIAVQYALYRAIIPRLEKQYPGSRRLPGVTVNARLIAAATLALLNLPGVYIAFAGEYPLPLWLSKAALYPYTIWQFGSIAYIIVLAMRKGWRYTASSIRTLTAKTSRNEIVPAPPPQDFDPSRRRLLKTATAAAPLYVLGAASIGSLDPDNYEVVRKPVAIEGLPEKLRGLKVAVVSDIHSGPYMNKAQMDAYVRIVNGLKPDITLLPGDFVNNKNAEVDPLCESFQHLRAEYGVYGCLGNHDYFDDENVIANEIQLCGVDMLRDAHKLIHPRGEAFSIIGVEDIGPTDAFDPHFKKAVKGLRSSTPHILMCHKPYYLDDAAQWGVDLMVSGHTHGGQIVFARFLDTPVSLATAISQYVEGFYTVDATQMYVTRGIGMVGIPVRWNCPPEVTLLTLEPA